MNPTKNSITTNDADLMTYHTDKTGQKPSMSFDQLTGKVVAEVSTDCREAFLNDLQLQRFLSVKNARWRAIGELRNKGVSRG